MNTENYHTFLAGQMTILTQKNEKNKNTLIEDFITYK